MKTQLNKLLITVFFVLFFVISKSYSIEEITELTNAINDAREELNNASEASTEQSKIIDEALKEIDKANEYVQEAINNNNTKDAIKTLEFIEKSLSDVESIIPQEFGTDMSNMDISEISKEDMDIVNEITSQMNVAKEEKLNKFMSELVDLNQKGIDTISISENLNSLGIDTIKISINLDGSKEIEKWTKEEWADAYNGSILTSTGSEIIRDEEINDKVVDLEQQLEVNNLEIINKRTSLTELQTQIDPLSNQITNLKTQRSNLLAKYNEEILKQSSSILSNEEINQSKAVADQFNNQLNDISIQITAAEQQSKTLQQQVQNLNLELSNEIATKTQIQNNLRELNNQLSANQNVISQKSSEINKLKNTNLSSKINSLNEQLQYASRERDFIQTDFERSIDLEVEALKRYHSALGSTEEEIDFAMREVGVVLDSDPRKARAFEIEKYATYAGFSNNQIQNAINAVNNDDWSAQKNIYKEITSALAKNPNWEVDIPSTAELNSMIEEEKAIQAAALASLDVEKINASWNEKIKEQTKDIQPLASLNLNTIKYAATWEGMKEHSFLVEETNKLLADASLDTKYAELEKAQQAYNEYMNKDWRAVNYEGYSLTTALELQNKKNELLWDAHTTEATIKSQARENVYAAAEKAQKEYNQIISQENPELKAVEEKVINILNKVPTFEASAENLAGLDATTLRAKLIDLTNGNNNETKALEAARSAVAKIGEAPVSEFMTGPTWQMTNVKAAAIVRSKKYDWVDDYAYINAEYQDPLNLNSSQREEIENELKNILSEDNVKLQSLNTKISQLSNELNLTQKQSQNLTTEISKLENELSSLKNSESVIQNQISELSNQFNSKESLIAEKTQTLSSLQEQLNPLSKKMNELQGQRTEIDTKLNSQLNTIANQIDSQGAATDEANVLKTQFENQIAELDNQIKEYENQSIEINNQLTSLTTELSTLEAETPEIANQIESLNKDLKNFANIKADLAIASAKKIGLNVDEQTLQSVNILDGKVIVAIKGTELVRVVDEKMLIDEAEKFIDPLSELSINSKIYSTNALKPELLKQELVSSTYEVAKEAREKATNRLRELEATPGASKADIEAAKASIDAAKYAEIAAGQSLVSNTDIASASISSQQKTLEALKQVASTPGMNKFDVQRANAAVKAAEAQIAGTNYDYLGAINKIAKNEQEFNVWRVADYKKEIEAAKANGNLTDLKAYTRRLNNFQQRLIDERKAFESATARTEYFEAISKVIGNSVGIADSSVQESVKAAAEGTKQASELQTAASGSIKGNEFTSAYDSAKTAREEIDKNLASLRQASGGATTEAIKAAEAARSAALQAEIAAANVVAANSTAVQEAAQVAAAAAQEAAQEVAQEASQVAQAAAQEAAEATLQTLKEVANTPGMSQWDVQRAQAAVKAQEAKMAGTEYDLQHALNTINQNKAYEEAGGEPNKSGRTWDGH